MHAVSVLSSVVFAGLPAERFRPEAGRMNDDSPAIAEFRQRLAETLAWCQPRFDPGRAKDSLRNPELAPSRHIVYDVHDLPEIAGIVGDVLARRRALVGSVPPASRLPDGDRILALWPQQSLWFGASPRDCDGFIDEADTPPWGSWVLLIGDVLLSWVPAAMVRGVESAIDMNVEDCIQWASSPGVPDAEDLLALGLIA
jgi:hypothetical protein